MHSLQAHDFKHNNMDTQNNDATNVKYIPPTIIVD